jgi:multiple sugar transport system permease protein
MQGDVMTTTTEKEQYEMTTSASEKAWRRRKKVKDLLKEVGGHVLVFVVGLFFLVPFLWMVSTSLKVDQDVFRNPPTWIPRANATVTIAGEEYNLYDVVVDGQTRQLAYLERSGSNGVFIDPAEPAVEITVPMADASEVLETYFAWENYPNALNRSTRTGLGVNFMTYFKNSLIISLFAVVGTLLSCAPVAYAFARIKFPGRDGFFLLVLSTMMLPFQVTMIPMYLLFNETLGWGDTFLPLIVPCFFANAYDVFLLRQFFRTIPEEMCDAARVDGASEFAIFLKIIIPLSVPVLATIAVFTFLWAWNDFLGPLLFLTSPQNFTMALGLQDFQGQHIVSWNLLMAASVLFTVPIIIAFFFAQKTFIQGIKLTGSKE